MNSLPLEYVLGLSCTYTSKISKHRLIPARYWYLRWKYRQPAVNATNYVVGYLIYIVLVWRVTTVNIRAPGLVSS